MGLSPNVSVVRNLSILSATRLRTPAPDAQGRAAASAPAASPAPAATFDVCQVGAVLRAVLFVEAVLAVAALFSAAGLADWLAQVATLTGGALPSVLLWLVAVCALRDGPVAGFEERYPLASALMTGHPPPWLVECPADAALPLRVYRYGGPPGPEGGCPVPAGLVQARP